MRRTTTPLALAAATAALAPLGASVAAEPVAATEAVPCSLAIDRFARPGGHVGGLRLVLGRIWLPRRVLRLNPRPGPGWDRYTKVGIVISAGTPVVLRVPQAWRRSYSLEYAANHVQTVRQGQTRLLVEPCPKSGGRWTAYAGGYVAKTPLCAQLVVRTRTRAQTIRVPIGRPCQ